MDGIPDPCNSTAIFDLHDALLEQPLAASGPYYCVSLRLPNRRIGLYLFFQLPLALPYQPVNDSVENRPRERAELDIKGLASCGLESVD
jgi:hypothetical protein